MPETRKSLETGGDRKNAPPKRRSVGESPNFRRMYPDLTATTSYASTTVEKTSEVQEDDDAYGTEAETSFASSTSSRAAESGEIELLKYGLAAFIVILIGICVAMALRSGKNETGSQYQKYIDLVRPMISSQFPDISKENREYLRLIGRKVFTEPENHAPLVILVGGVEAKQFSEAVSNIIFSLNPDENYRKSTENRSIRVESDTNRAELHESLQKALGTAPTSSSSESSSSGRSAVVLDVDLLKWDAVLVLHAFADHEKYPVPKTVLFLTVPTPKNHSEGQNCDETMVGFLTNRWIENGGSVDNIPPIIARISYFLCV